MATWQTNGVGYAPLNIDGTAYMFDGEPVVNTKGVMAGYEWTSGYLTYSFAGVSGTGAAQSASYAPNYGSDGDASEWHQLNNSSNFFLLNATERSAVTKVLGIYEKFANLHFTPVIETENGSSIGDLRFAATNDVDAPAYAFAYYPYSDPSAGDVWFSTRWMDSHRGAHPGELNVGQYDFLTIIHEVGHALGLKHPFDIEDQSHTTLPPEIDNIFHTVMSYDVKEGVAISDVGADRYPTTPMYYDILALQLMYGQSTDAHPGDTLYKYTEHGKYWLTINDSGGTDTIQYVSTTGGFIDLREHQSNLLGDPIVFDDGDISFETVWIGPGTVIENALGGAGSDGIYGNDVRNSLTGGGGYDDLFGFGDSDRLYGNSGNDQLHGGRGNDTLTGGVGADKFVFDAGLTGSADRIADFSHVDDTIQLAHSIFATLSKGALMATRYYEGINVDVQGATALGQRILYDTDSGKLYYDNDGSGPHGKVLIATLTGSPDALDATDFKVI
jgi:hypothetical protein